MPVTWADALRSRAEQKTLVFSRRARSAVVGTQAARSYDEKATLEPGAGGEISGLGSARAGSGHAPTPQTGHGLTHYAGSVTV